MSIFRATVRIWERYEGPTWLVACAVYGGWFALTRYHAAFPWWAVASLGAWLVAWHGSLQHETIHALTRVPRPIRAAIAHVPLGLFFPYGSYRREHRRHHSGAGLTEPHADPESFYHSPEDWARYSPFERGLFRLNQTLLGRLTIGAALQALRTYRADAQRIARGDRKSLLDWTVHLLLVVLVFGWVVKIAAMPWWQYVLLIAYPGLCLSMLRSFYEHRWSGDAGRRTATIENRFPFGLLFLNNNYHVVHHDAPALPWYRIPAVWNEQRVALLERSGGFHFSGYGTIARRWFVRQVFEPVRPPR